MPLSQIKFNYEEKSVIWVTKRLTESHFFSVLCSVYIFALSCYSNEKVTTFKRDSSRLWIQALATITAVYAMWLEIYWFPPAKVSDERYMFLKTNLLGYFHFLTLWIQTICTIYSIFGFIAEFTIHYPSYYGPNWVTLKFCYSIMPFVHSTAVMLAILFFKFCWFDEEWQEIVVVRLKKRGYHNVRPITCFTHICWVAIALVDIFYLKRSSVELIQPLNHQLIWSAFFGGFYMIIMYSFHIWCGQWPYPFLNNMGKVQRFIFFSVIVGIFMCFSMLASYLISWLNK